MTAVEAPPRTAGHAPHRHTVPLTRLTLVELRKLADTRAGLWLLIVIALASAGTAAILLFAGSPEEQVFAEFVAFAQLPAGVLMPVLGILSVTSEWSQRTALTTFTLVPQRGRILAAKLIAAVLIAVLATAVSVVFAVVGNLLAPGMDGDGSWANGGELILKSLLLQVIVILMGCAFGALLLNSPLAIVLFFAVPTLWTILGESIRALRTAAGWLDINQTMIPLSETGMTGDNWAKLGVSVAAWVLLPMVVGTIRVLRREVS